MLIHGHGGWVCWFCCHGDTEEPSRPGAVNHDPDALSCAWGLDLWCPLVWMLFCCWSWCVTFCFSCLFCNGECDDTDVIWGVDCMLGWVSLVVALGSLVLVVDGISSCSPGSRLIIRAMTLKPGCSAGEGTWSDIPPFFMGLTAWKSGLAGLFPCVDEAVNVGRVAYTCCRLWVMCGVM